MVDRTGADPVTDPGVDPGMDPGVDLGTDPRMNPVTDPGILLTGWLAVEPYDTQNSD